MERSSGQAAQLVGALSCARRGGGFHPRCRTQIPRLQAGVPSPTGPLLQTTATDGYFSLSSINENKSSGDDFSKNEMCIVIFRSEISQ